MSDSHADLAGTRIAYRTYGPQEGSPVVLLHGLASSGASWTEVAESLAATGRRCVVPDQRGHGRSGRPGDYRCAALRDDVLGVLDHLGVDRADLVGHSMGGHAASLVALAAPARVRRLVLEDAPPPRRSDEPAPSSTPRWLRLLSLARGVAHARKLLSFDRRATAVVDELRRTDDGWWRRMGTLAVPTLLVSGGDTSHVPPARLAALAAAMPDAELVTVAGAGHRVHSSRPTEFARLVAEFLG